MKKTILLFLTALLSFGLAAAQPVPQTDGRGPHGCDIVITGSFDSQCIYDFKDAITDEYPDLMVACKNSTVTYTAYDNSGTSTIVSYTWSVFGDLAHTATGNQLTVDWSGDEWGMVIVTVVNSNGDTCTGYSRVKLIDIPTAACATVPAYSVLPNGDKVVHVCQGASVQFIDQSTAGNSDIAGYFWQSSQADPSSNPNYLVENVMMNDKVIHRVYNNCGCYDEEVIFIEVLSGDILELECYGTACENDIVHYHATNPICNKYHWYVEGGTLVGGQGTDSPVVQWDHPTDGYGVIGLDGFLCGELVCPALMSRRVPVIHSHLSIKGQTDVCPGESVLFSLPLFGSTEYNWTLTPATGANTEMVTQSNEARIVFLQPGTYVLRCSYYCAFLDCGPYEADSLVITVKPSLDIVGHDQICVANACDLHTSPSVSASWTAYDLSLGNQVAATATGTSFTHTFLHAGRYLVTAQHPDHCGPATFVLDVKNVPPAPSADDLAASNRHTACPWNGIALAGTPSDSYYSLVWEPTCSTASPQLYSGDSVTISYQADVCDVRVYNYDRVLHCMSSAYHVHQVDVLVPAPLHIPANITVCPGSIITWGNNEVPDQSSEGMLYEWTLQDTRQHYASVQGSHLSNGITLAVNEGIPAQTSFYVKLTRTFCGGSVDTLITITVVDTMTHTLSISGPDTVCWNSSATYTGSGGNPSNYRWEIESGRYSNNPVTHTFTHEGVGSVVLYECPYTYCTNRTYLNRAEKTVFVSPLPMVQGLTIDDADFTVSVVPPLNTTDYLFSWGLQAQPGFPVFPLLEQGNQIQLSSEGTYFCTVTDVHTGCSRTVSAVYSDDNSGIPCNALSLTGTYNYCDHTLYLGSDHYVQVVGWVVTGGSNSISKHGLNNRYADVTFNNVGIYTVKASTWDGNCYGGKYVQTVDFIPEFQFEAACDRIIIHNSSKYALPAQNVYLTVTNSCNNAVDVIQIPASQTSYTYIPPAFFDVCTFTFTLTGYGTNGSFSSCVLGTSTIGSPMFASSPVVSISTANIYSPGNTCDNTPIELSASLSYAGAIVSSTWDFDDGSTFHTQGNSVFHTFKNNASNYYVTVSIVDNRGCTKAMINPYQITSNANGISGGQLSVSSPEVCPYVATRNVQFSISNPNNHYQWWRLKAPTRVTHANPYLADRSDDYFVHVVNDNYCQREATTFVKFRNAPTARIHADNFTCCVGNTLRLYGDEGPGTDPLSYAWTITDGNGYLQTATTPDISFTAPVTGTFTASLTVTNTVTTCSSTATETITVNSRPTAPSISFISSPPCISNPPVQLTATGFSGELHWNNGTTGPTADYYTHGWASAYYYDPTLGCPSGEDSIRIHRQPDFDALLTGCYLKCKDYFTRNLPVYGLTDNAQFIDWDWEKDASTIATGSGSYFDTPLLLPLIGTGDYTLSVDYSGGSCNKVSPKLSIDEKDLCDCDSLQITYDTALHVEDCRLHYDVTVTVCNNSLVHKRCFDQLRLDPLAGQSIDNLSTDFVPTDVDPLDCFHFTLSFDVLGLEPSAIFFTLVATECEPSCEKTFSIDLAPQVPNCNNALGYDNIAINTDLTNDAVAYFDFEMNVSPCGNLIAFWSEPPMLVNYSFDPISGHVTGLGMLDRAVLSKLLYETEKICFHAISCCEDQLCHQRYCTDASKIDNLLQNLGAKQGKHATVDSSLPLLMPNPTTGEVTVEATDRVDEVLLMDMYGRQQVSFQKTAHFDISSLPSGSYIVRVTTRRSDTSPAKTTYLKLVKK